MEWNRKPVFGVGINDIKEKTRGTKAYLVWKSMLARCYSEYTRKDNPAYDGCSVCNEWLVLSAFVDWFNANYIQGTQLDKDILVPGNKVYSPSTCCFVPQELNKLFSGHTARKSLSPGIRRQNRQFIAEFRHKGKRHKRGFYSFDDAKEWYSRFRNEAIKEAANKFLSSGQISLETYNAIMTYAV